MADLFRVIIEWLMNIWTNPSIVSLKLHNLHPTLSIIYHISRFVVLIQHYYFAYNN